MTRLRNTFVRTTACLAGCLAVVCATAAPRQPMPNVPEAPSIAGPSPEHVGAALIQWFTDTPELARRREAVARLWQNADQLDRPTALELVGRTLSAGSPELANLSALMALSDPPIPLPEVQCLSDESLPEVVRQHARLLYGRWLVHQRMFEEALEILEPLSATDVVDPSAVLFYRAVACQRLLRKDEGLAALRSLLDDVPDVPARYRALAELMNADLAALEPETLDHIARRMDDVTRRLSLGRPGPKTREVEDGVLDSLDKMIEELEKQQQEQQQQQSSSGGGNLSPNMPAQDSRILGGSGPGQVSPRAIGDESGWGGLPPKEREEALQQIGQDFPAHYRDVIEQYFRRLAGESTGNTEP